jgi:3-oxoacyl-[acyl-carrier-protein] synthase II
MAAGLSAPCGPIKAINHGVVPPTLNLDNPSEGCDIDLVPHHAKEKKVSIALSNSFGFGGTNASLIFRAV